MFRLVAGGFGIVVMALMALAVFAVEYPWQTLLITAAVGTVLVAGVREQRKRRTARLFGLDLRSMSPTEYEVYCGELLRRAGWSVRHVGRQGDQGVDVVAELRGTRAAIQCKKFSRGVCGNAAVQQIVAGKRHYGAQIAVVACPVPYTRAAQDLANSNAVLLVSHADLPRLESIARIP